MRRNAPDFYSFFLTVTFFENEERAEFFSQSEAIELGNVKSGERVHEKKRFVYLLEEYQESGSLKEEEKSRIELLVDILNSWSRIEDYSEKTIRVLEDILKEIELHLNSSTEMIEGDVCDSGAAVYSKLGHSMKALDWFNKALHVLEKRLGSEHPNLRIVQENIDALKSKML